MMTDDSLKERARRVLMDNPDPAAHPPAGPAFHADEIELRLKAIRTVRELEPKRVCMSERVRDLSISLVETPGDSIHYKTLLEKLKEAHEELQRLEERLWAANHVIRSTQWLIDLLADPSHLPAEAAAGRTR